MSNTILKYLVVKMYFGLGSSDTKCEIHDLCKFLNDKGIETDSYIPEDLIEEVDNIYYATYKIDGEDVGLKDIECFKLLSEFAVRHLYKEHETDIVVTDSNKARAESLSIYLIAVINYIKKLKLEGVSFDGHVLENFDEDITEPIEDYSELFSRLSNRIARMLQEFDNSEYEDLDDLIIGNTVPHREISSYKSYCNFQLINASLDGELSEAFGKDFSFVLKFGTSSYYSMDSVLQDLILVTNNVHAGDFFGPIYICKTDAPDWKSKKKHDYERARHLISKLVKDNK